VDMLHTSRTESLEVRIGEFRALVPEEGHVTLRDLKRGSFSEAEVKQICGLTEGEFVYWVHEDPRGGTPSPRVKRCTKPDAF